MDYHLDQKIRLIEETKHPALYKWALQEFTEDGKNTNPELSPWPWTLQFTASDLKHVKYIKISSNTKENSDSEHINVVLKPSEFKLRNWGRPTRFSMFGTNRYINDFSLTIYRLENDQEFEKCQAWGIVSYTCEIDFLNHTTDDMMGFNIWLKPKNFNDIRDAIYNKSSDDQLQLSVKGGSGFYSEWSPSISTDYVKILAHGHEQQVIKSEESDEPPKLGYIDEFELNFIRQNNLTQPSADLELSESENDLTSDQEKSGFAVSSINTETLVKLGQLQANIAKLKTPLWIIVILLLIFLMRH